MAFWPADPNVLAARDNRRSLVEEGIYVTMTTMKYPYYIEYIDSDSPIMRLPKEIEVVTPFLFGNIQAPTGEKDCYLEEIDRVLRGEEPISEIGGNACGLII